MKLFEYEAKEIFRKYGIDTAPGCVVQDPVAARLFVETLGKPVVVKAQLAVGGRGKEGGIQFANTPNEAFDAARLMLGRKIKGLPVRKLLIEEKLDIRKELFLGVTVDRSERCFTFLASAVGGMNIEDVAVQHPEKIIRFSIDPVNNFRIYHALGIAKKLGYSGKKLNQLALVIQTLYRLAYDMDAELTEINPLAEVEDGFVAADARLNMDNNALFRHMDMDSEERVNSLGELTLREMEAHKKGLVYVELDGDIGIIGNGAGLTMATLDTVMLNGGKAGNFLDLGGGASPEKIGEAVEFVLKDDHVKALLVNVLGGITKCDDTAKGIVAAQKKLHSEKPIVVRMMGTNEEDGKRILNEAGINFLETMEDAATLVVDLARRN